MDEPLPVSVLLLARDEATRLADLLPRLRFARDIVVVVDSATRDGTREVARAHGARILERRLDGFGAQRQHGLDHCREPWVLWIDADERLDAAAERAIAEVVRSDAEVGSTVPRGTAAPPAEPAGARVAAAFRLRRRPWFLGREIRHCGWGGERVVRLFRRAAAHFDPVAVHERVIVRGAVAELSGSLHHHSYENWTDCLTKLMRYAELGAEEARRRGRRAGPLDVLWRPPLRFLRMYVAQAGVLDGGRGLAVCALAAAGVFLKYMGLWLGCRAADGPRRAERGGESESRIGSRPEGPPQ